MRTDIEEHSQRFIATSNLDGTRVSTSRLSSFDDPANNAVGPLFPAAGASGAPRAGGFASAVERATLPSRADLSQLAGAGDTMCRPSLNKYG